MINRSIAAVACGPLLVCLATGCSGAPSTTAGESAERSTAPLSTDSPPPRSGGQTVQTLTWPGAICDLSAPGMSNVLQVVADKTGVVSFFASPADPSKTDAKVALDCQDDAGRTGHFDVDLAAASTFEPPKVSWPAESIRPALAGDPTQYSQADLWKGGYGHRPNPKTQPAMYALWERTATAPMRLADSPPHSLRGSMTTVTDTLGFTWAGGSLTQSNPPSAAYDFAIYSFLVPQFSDTTTGCSNSGFWGGLGGISGPLIQTGLIETTGYVPFLGGVIGTVTPFYQFAQAPGTTTAACYYNTCSFNFSGIMAGDQMFGESAACNSSGDLDYSGGFGCFWLADFSQNPPVGQSTMLPDLEPFVGESADAIAEDSSMEAQFCGTAGNEWLNFGSVKIELQAERTDTGSTEHNFGSDNSTAWGIEGLGTDSTPDNNLLDWPVVDWDGVANTVEIIWLQGN